MSIVRTLTTSLRAFSKRGVYLLSALSLILGPATGCDAGSGEEGADDRADHQCGPNFADAKCGVDRCCSTFDFCGGLTESHCGADEGYAGAFNGPLSTSLTGDCFDSLRNGDETGVDCGGRCGTSCSTTPTCSDSVQNGDETGVDCGGSCPACVAAPTCSDNAQNGDETGVDCGGSCPACVAAPTCSDNAQNGDETGVDCGGSCAQACPMCSETAEGGAVSLSCGSGVISAIEFANYGLTDGACGGFTAQCAYADTAAYVQAQCVGQSACTINATNGTFGNDPCPNISKKLVVQYACGAPSCSDSVQNGDETGVDCGGSCNACVRRFYNALNNGTIYSYPDVDSVLTTTNFTNEGSNSDLANDIDVFAFEGVIYRVTESGQLYSYPDVAALAANSGTLVGTNSGLTDFLDFIVSKNGSGQTWIYAIKPVGNSDKCGIHSFGSPSKMVADDFSYHGSAGDDSCYIYDEFFLSSVGDRGAGHFYASKDNGDIYYFQPTGPPTNNSWSADFDYGSPVKVGSNVDLGASLNVGIFLH